MAKKPDIPAERVRITVQPSAAHPDVLTIQDAMRQVLDFFDLLTPEDQQDGYLVWNLRVATTNSPFTVEGEATSLNPDVDITVVARAQKALLAENFLALKSGVRPPRPLSSRKRATLRNFMRRNTNGIGKTEAIISAAEPPVIVTPVIAIDSMRVLEDEENEIGAFLPSVRQREEIGSVEAILLDVGSDYNQPAIRVRERKSGRELWCRVSPELQSKISKEANFKDVWEHRRVIVRGRIAYDDAGDVLRVHATSLIALKPRTMTLHDIKDSNFTSGDTTLDYLERLREGDFG